MESMRATWTDTRLDEFVANVDKRFDAVDMRFDAVDERFDAVDKRLTRLDYGFGEVLRRLETIDVDIRDMRGEMGANSRSMLQFCGGHGRRPDGDRGDDDRALQLRAAREPGS